MYRYVCPPLNDGRDADLRESFMSKCIKQMEKNAPQRSTRVTFESLKRAKYCSQKYVLALVTEVRPMHRWKKLVKRRLLDVRDIILNDSGGLEDNSHNTAVSRLELIGDYAQLGQCIDKGDMLMISEFRVFNSSLPLEEYRCPLRFTASSESQTNFELFFMPIEEERMKQLGIDRTCPTKCAKLIQCIEQFGLKLTDDNDVYPITEVVSLPERDFVSSSWGNECPALPSDSSEVDPKPGTSKSLATLPRIDHSHDEALSESEMPMKSKKKSMPAFVLAKIEERKLRRSEKQNKGSPANIIAKIEERKLKSWDKQKRQKIEESPASNTAGIVAHRSEITGAHTSCNNNKSTIPLPSLSSNATTDGASTNAASITVPVSTTSVSVSNAPVSTPSLNLPNGLSVTASTGESSDSETKFDGIRAFDERLLSVFDESVANITITRNSFEASIKNSPRVIVDSSSKPLSHSFINIKDIVPGYFDIECQVLAVYFNTVNPSHAIMIVWDGTKPPKPYRMPLFVNYTLKFKDFELSKIEDYVVAINVFDDHVAQLDKLKMYEIVRLINVRAKLSVASMLLDLNGGGRHFKRGINPMTAGSDWSNRLEERMKTTRSAMILRTLVEWCSSKTGIEKSSKKTIPGQNESVNIDNHEVDLHDAVENCDYIIRVLTEARKECAAISESSSRMNMESNQLTRVQKNPIHKSPCDAALDHSIKAEPERVLANKPEVPFQCIKELAYNIIKSFQVDHEQGEPGFLAVQGGGVASEADENLFQEPSCTSAKCVTEDIINVESMCQELCSDEQVPNEDCVVVSSQDDQLEDALSIKVQNNDVDKLWKNLPNDPETCQQLEGSVDKTPIEIDETPENNLPDDQSAIDQVDRLDEPLIESVCETKDDCPEKHETEGKRDYGVSENKSQLVEKNSSNLRCGFAGRKSVNIRKSQTQYKDSNEENSSVVDPKTSRSEMNNSDGDFFCKMNLMRISDITTADHQDRCYSVKELASAMEKEKYQFRGAIIDVFPRSDHIRTAFKMKCKLCQTKFPLTVNSPRCRALGAQGVQSNCDLTPTFSFKMRLCDPFLSTIDVIVCDDMSETFFWGYEAKTLQKSENQQLLSVTIDQLCPNPTFLNCHSSILHCKLMPVVEDKIRRLYVVDTVLRCLCEFQNCGN